MIHLEKILIKVMLSILEANYRGENILIYISDNAIKHLEIHLKSLKIIT